MSITATVFTVYGFSALVMVLVWLLALKSATSASSMWHGRD